ncbi:MAG: 3-hydroxyisobutyrate dehydrogenase [Pseudomonadales bacterium]|nr:3-hydroxyisobutyrate dehydrogenase [Pseudomonadales bacterium]
MDTPIAFFGLGQMGGRMAQRLLDAGLSLDVHDPAPACLQALLDHGAHAFTPGAARHDIVISMLPHDKAVHDLYLGTTGLLRQLSAGTLVIDCSTVSPELSRQLHQEAQTRSLDFLDAPVSGGVTGAAAGTLSFLCGGSASVVTQAQPVLSLMGQNIMHAGPAGAGSVAKLCNNMLLAIHMLGTCEALNLGVKQGLDPATLSTIMQKSSGRNWSLEVYNPWPGVMPQSPASQSYRGGFQSQLMLKDLTLAHQSAEAWHVSTPLGSLAQQLYAQHVAKGHEQEDFSGILQLIRSMESLP